MASTPNGIRDPMPRYYATITVELHDEDARMLHEATGIAPPLCTRGLPMAMIAGKGNVIVEVADMADAIPEALRAVADVYEAQT
jgi:hypothetical protein